MPDLNIAFSVFNRPAHTQKTFQSIREQRPDKLFIIADGPRKENANDLKNCKLVRSLLDSVDWPCAIYKNYAETNMGLKNRVSSGLDWVFSQVEEAIILEDDCLANPDFFNFCSAMLKKYKDENRVFAITGNNFQNGHQRGEASYYFSKYPHCWGWATWRRAWEKYEGQIPFWPEWKHSPEWKSMNTNDKEEIFWTSLFDKVYEGRMNSWAFPWMASLWKHSGLTVTPGINLVTNIGHGPEATNTITIDKMAEIPSYRFNISAYPKEIKQDITADNYVLKNTFGVK
jgi:hypothetical protein